MMKICVLVKQVPDKNDKIKLNQDQISVDTQNFNFALGENLMRTPSPEPQ